MADDGAVSVCQRWVILGGEGLMSPWVPSRVVCVGDLQFIELGAYDGRLQTFLGTTRPKALELTNALRHLRNEATDEYLLAQLKDEDPMGVYTELPLHFNRHKYVMPDFLEVPPAPQSLTMAVRSRPWT